MNQRLQEAALSFCEVYDYTEQTPAHNRARLRLECEAMLATCNLLEDIRLLDGGVFDGHKKPVIAFLRETAEGILKSLDERESK